MIDEYNKALSKYLVYLNLFFNSEIEYTDNCSLSSQDYLQESILNATLNCNDIDRFKFTINKDYLKQIRANNEPYNLQIFLSMILFFYKNKECVNNYSNMKYYTKVVRDVYSYQFDSEIFYHIHECSFNDNVRKELLSRILKNINEETKTFLLKASEGNFSKVAKEMNITRQAVRQKYNRRINKLKKVLNAQ